MKGVQLVLIQLTPPRERVSGSWRPQEDRTLRAFYRTHTTEKLASMLNRSESSVRTRCWTLGLCGKSRPWTEDELARLRAAYENAKFNRALCLDVLAKELTRHKTNVSRKARSLGLTNQRRPTVPTEELKIKRPRFATKEEYSKHLSERAKRYIREHGHPRGALGMRHSAEAKARISELHRAAWADPNSKHNSEANRQRRSDLMHKRMREGKMCSGKDTYSRCASGPREDLGGQFFRSRWEANYARYLNHLLAKGEVVSWGYECHRFAFEKAKRGIRSYTPDFKLVFPDGHHEWHEVKGWMDDASRGRLERMTKFYPNETVVVIGAEQYRYIEKTLGPTILGWERPGAKNRTVNNGVTA